MSTKNQCLIKECYHTCESKYEFKSNDCILYCDKDDWYDIVDDKKDWSKSIDKIEKFWQIIYEKKHKNKNRLEYNHIVFPKFLNNLNCINKSFKKSKNESSFLIEKKFVEFRNCIFEDDLILENVFFTNKVSFEDSTFKKGIILTKSIFINIVNFSKAKFEGEVLLKDTFFLNSIYLNRAIIKDKFIFIAKKFQVDNYQGDKDIFNFLKIMVKSYSLRHLHLEETILDKEAFVEFRGFYTASEIHNMQFSTLTILNFINYSKSFKLSNIEIDGTFNVINSNLGIAEFNNIDLSENKNKKENMKIPHKIEFKDSSLVNTKFNNIDWDKAKNITGSREDFRQLKNTLDNQRNYIDANLMHKKELEHYHEKLKNTTDFQNKMTKFVLDLSEKFSNHGSCYLQPLLIFLGWSLIAFVAYMFFIQTLFINDFFNKFGLFMNPFVIKVPDEFKNGLLWWIFYKTISAFILYHFVIALKRKVKR